MPCLSYKMAFYTAVAAAIASGAAALGQESVGVPPAAIIEFLAAATLALVAQQALVECLDAAGRHEDAESLRREVDQLKREVSELEARAH